MGESIHKSDILMPSIYTWLSSHLTSGVGRWKMNQSKSHLGRALTNETLIVVHFRKWVKASTIYMSNAKWPKQSPYDWSHLGCWECGEVEVRPGVRHGPRLLPRPARALAALKLGVEILENITHHIISSIAEVCDRGVSWCGSHDTTEIDINDPGYLLYFNQLLV